jgi:glycosyltransferase involved in cell wall biosynthesis
VTVRLAVHTDQEYLRDAQGVSTARAFVIFLGALAADPRCASLTVAGRLRAAPGRSHHALPAGVAFAGLPEGSGAGAPPRCRLRSLAAACRCWWRVLDGADAVWLVGPNPLSFPFAAMALARRRRVTLGVRQDLPTYVRARHPGRPVASLAARVLDAGFRALARRTAVVVVGPALAARYAAAPRVLKIAVSLVRDEDLRAPDAARAWDGRLKVISITRLDTEKNPLMLADVLARLDARWQMVVCGDGPLEGALRRRLLELGIANRAELLGHVPVDGGLLELARACHALLHVSWTEGVPQVLFEAAAAGLPTVATAVGGVPATARGAALLVAPGDSAGAAAALERLASDPRLRERLVRAGRERMRARTLEREAAATVAFLAGASQPAAASARQGRATVSRARRSARRRSRRAAAGS